MDTRRSAAVQFFLEEDSESADYKSVVQWLNDAALASDAVKLDLLRKVKEIILHKDSSLLDNFLDEMLAFQNDRSAEVRKYIVGFIEEALKKDPEVLPRVASNLALLAQDSSIQVQKRIVQAASNIYRNTLSWLAKVRTVTEEMENAWLLIGKIKEQIIIMLDSENDGLRTQSVKFLETVVLLQTYPEVDSQGRGDDFSLEDVPLTLKIARRRKLEEEANKVFELLLKFLNSPHISSINLMTSVASLLLIAKKRPLFMSQVISAIEKLRNNLPPTLSQSQIVSATKHIKTQLLLMLKHPSSVEFQGAITTLLTDLGATNHEITKAFPQLDELRRRQKRMAESAAQVVQAKKPRIEVVVQESEDSDDDSETEDTPLAENQLEVAVSVTEAFIVERLTAELAIQMVMQAMLQLPDTMPPHFSSSYTPIAAAGTTKQIKTVGRLLATQMTASGIGPGIKEARKVVPLEPVPVLKPSPVLDIDEGSKSPAPVLMAKIKEEPKEKGLRAAVLTKPSKIRTKTLKLSEITKPLGKDVASRMLASALTRILRSERIATMAGAGLARSKIITTLASTFSPNVRDVVLSFILEDLRRHIDLCLGWLYEEYSFMQGFNRFPAKLKKDQAVDFNYNQLLCRVVRTLMNMPDHKDRDGLLIRLYLESPMITEEATDLLKAMCGDETRASIGLPLLQELVTKRPPKQLTFLNALLVHTAHENAQVRTKAIDCVIALYSRGDLRNIIEEYSILYLSFLRLPQPPEVLFGPERGRPNKEDAWSEDLVKACLYLYLTLVPINQTLIHELAQVYSQTVALVKRIVLRCVEHPISGMGMESPELLKLVEDCPKGAETLVTRVIHILTDKVPPSAELVARVRELYHTRVSDVRFLIPVLTGLSKKEVISALPKLIKLNPVVVKEVFNRLLGTHTDLAHSAQITPAELLIALHNIDQTKAELKFVIKATSMCFAEQQAYTQEVLAVVMQNLMELNPLPTLLMRTVIQSMSLYPRLIGFVMNILQRLILKQVWKQRKVWEGFIKCCQRTQPQSFQVLLQLPPLQLGDVFASSPDIQPALLAHVSAFTEHQRAHVSQAIMDVLTGKVTGTVTDFDESSDPSLLMPGVGLAEDGSHNMEPLPPGME